MAEEQVASESLETTPAQNDNLIKGIAPIAKFSLKDSWTDNKLLIVGLMTGAGIIIFGNIVLIAMGKTPLDSLTGIAQTIIGGLVGYLSKDTKSQ